MALHGLDHVTVNCADLARSRAFYVEALGMTDGDRPPFPFPGAWLYLGGRPVVHLIGGVASSAETTGSFDHVAFEAEDIDTLRSRLEAQGVAFHENNFAAIGLRQLFFPDPDGVKIELNFRG
jgi:catechol 2,3-dioxygenase-like lactoylglutathione lyase family enzyme